jgi:hypothetical protein
MEINNNFTGFSSSVFVFDDLFVVGFGKKNNTVLNTEFYSFRKWGLQLSSIEKPMIQVHPNPCSNQLIINLNELTNVSKLSILDYSGKLLMDIDLNLHPNSITVDISNLAQGIYFVKMKDTNIRFVKN